ncbi:MAG TPA: LLM class F420-dependent oxidoreductase [Ktedonobacterales bacterium]|jgi:F420-dependent oxidoreductase-like protein
MRIGVHVPNFTWPGGAARLGETFGAIAERADQAGLYSLSVMDHFFQIGPHGPMDHDMLEGWSALAFAAARTSRIRLGTIVTGVTYRHPGLLVKTCTTLDVLSGGRAFFGIGAAWNEDEHRGLGVPFPPLAERFERLEEALQIAHQMWADAGKADEAKPFAGKYYHLERTLNVPQSTQRPHPPIMIGGGGEQKTLRLVAQYADACNLFARLGDDGLRHKLDVLREHCDRLGRPYAEIEKTAQVGGMRVTRDGDGGSMTPAQVVESFANLAEMGIDRGIVTLSNVSEPDAFELLGAEVVPELEKIQVAGR